MEEISLVIAGNKVDLEDKIKISEEEGRQYAIDNNMDFMITSAKTGNNVEMAFKKIITLILDEISQDEYNVP